MHGGGGHVSDTAILMSGSEEKPVVKKDGDVSEVMEEEINDDHELTALNNGPIRFPYVKDQPRAEVHNPLTWDEDDAQVTALDLLKEVNDGDMMLFALPSFLPIYAKNRGA